MTPDTLPLGNHLIVEFYDAVNLYDGAAATPALTQAVSDAGATLLKINVHDFGERSGFTGVAVLAESHLSIHTWPEHGYAAIDIFMCGDSRPELCLEALKAYFEPGRVVQKLVRRGLLAQDEPSKLAS